MKKSINVIAAAICSLVLMGGFQYGGEETAMTLTETLGIQEASAGYCSSRGCKKEDDFEACTEADGSVINHEITIGRFTYTRTCHNSPDPMTAAN